MINFVLTDSRNYKLVQEQIISEIKKYLPEGSFRESIVEYVDGCVNFTLFIEKEADVIMSHGAADKNYHFRRVSVDGSKTERRINHERKRKHIIVPGEWLKSRIVNSKHLEFGDSNVHALGWPRLDYLTSISLENAGEQTNVKKKILWAPTHDYARRGKESVTLSSYPEFSPFLEELKKHYDVEVSLHPRNRKDKKPTDDKLLAADVVITDFGTLVYEAYALGKQVIFPSWLIGERILKYLKHSAEHAIFHNGYGIHASSFEDMINAIDNERPISADSERFFNQFMLNNFNNDFNSAKEIASFLLRLSNNSSSVNSTDQK